MKKLGVALALALSLSMSFTAFAGGMGKGAVTMISTDSSVVNSQAVLTGLSATDTTQNTLMMGSFSPYRISYDVRVQSDIYGVLLKPTAVEGADIKVTAAITPGAYGETDKAEALEIEPVNGGYIVPLTQTHEGYDSEFVQTATIDVTKGDAHTAYTVKITRDCDTDIYNKFKQETFTAADGTVLAYNIYVPTNYDASKKYPVVLALHGGGQKTQPIDMVLKRYQMATVWAKDSEAGHNECIVIAPHTQDEWARIGTGVLTPDGQAAIELVKSLGSRYNVDNNRLYVLGASMGGIGTIGVLYNYPDTFAASIPCCAKGVPEYSRFTPMSGRILYCHAEDDPTVTFENGVDIMNGLTAAGVSFNKQIYPTGSFFYPTAHFSWVPAYGNKANRDWLFSKSR